MYDKPLVEAWNSFGPWRIWYCVERTGRSIWISFRIISITSKAPFETPVKGVYQVLGERRHNSVLFLVGTTVYARVRELLELPCFPPPEILRLIANRWAVTCAEGLVEAEERPLRGIVPSPERYESCLVDMSLVVEDVLIRRVFHDFAWRRR